MLPDMFTAGVVLVFLRDSLNDWANEHIVKYYARLTATSWPTRKLRN